MRHLLSLALVPIGAAVALFVDVPCGSFIAALGFIASGASAPAEAA